MAIGGMPEVLTFSLLRSKFADLGLGLLRSSQDEKPEGKVLLLVRLRQALMEALED